MAPRPQRVFSEQSTLGAATTFAILLVAVALAGCMMPPVSSPTAQSPGAVSPPVPLVQQLPATFPIQLTLVELASLPDWQASDTRPALLAFRRSCAAFLEKASDVSLGGLNYAGTTRNWRDACEAADVADGTSARSARAFFESSLAAYRVTQGATPGLFTGYYEPELKGSRRRHGPYQTPLYGLPADLVTIDLGLFRDTFKGQRLAGRLMNGRLVPYPARAEIVAQGLNAQPLFYVDDPVDAFFMQIQGSGRVALDDGSIVRAAFAGQNGQPYTAIGAVLVERGEFTREQISLQVIRAWMAAHPGEAQDLMNANASYVFFSEQPIGDPRLGAKGTEGVALTPEASIAVDTGIHALGVPAWLETTAPDADPSKPDRSFNRLFVMQDTGGAIRGAIRGDIYWGYGQAAASIAGRMRAEGRLTVLLPKSVAAKLGQSASFSGPR